MELVGQSSNDNIALPQDLDEQEVRKVLKRDVRTARAMCIAGLIAYLLAIGMFFLEEHKHKEAIRKHQIELQEVKQQLADALKGR